MKFKIIGLLLLISIKTNCQLRNLNKFYSEKLTAKHEKNIGVYEISVYKIKGKIYETDYKNYFSSDKEIIFKYTANDMIRLMIYNKRYLFIGYYPDTKQNRMSAIPPEVWLLNRLEVIDIEDVSKQWQYQLDEKTCLRNIKSFNPNNGDIVYSNLVKPEKKSTE